MAGITVAVNILLVIAAVSIYRVPDIALSAHWHLVFECSRHAVGTADCGFVGLASEARPVIPRTCHSPATGATRLCVPSWWWCHSLVVILVQVLGI